MCRVFSDFRISGLGKPGIDMHSEAQAVHSIGALRSAACWYGVTGAAPHDGCVMLVGVMILDTPKKTLHTRKTCLCMRHMQQAPMQFIFWS